MMNPLQESFSAQFEQAVKDGRIILMPSKILVDLLKEKTPGNGIQIEAVTIKDGVVTGAVTGNVTGNVTGDLTGNVIAPNGALATPSVIIGDAENGFYQVSSTQIGVSIGDALIAMFTANGLAADGVFPRIELVTAGTGSTQVTNGDGRNFTTTITLATASLTIAGAANEATGVLIATFPDSAMLQTVTYMNVALQGGGTVDSDTPEVGVGSVVGTGAVAILGGTATFEDHVTGTAASDCNGTATEVLEETSFSQLDSAGTNTIYLNVAGAWSGADTITATGTVTIQWTLLS